MIVKQERHHAGDTCAIGKLYLQKSKLFMIFVHTATIPVVMDTCTMTAIHIHYQVFAQHSMGHYGCKHNPFKEVLPSKDAGLIVPWFHCSFCFVLACCGARQSAPATVTDAHVRQSLPSQSTNYQCTLTAI